MFHISTDCLYLAACVYLVYIRDTDIIEQYLCIYLGHYLKLIIADNECRLTLTQLNLVTHYIKYTVKQGYVIFQ